MKTKDMSNVYRWMTDFDLQQNMKRKRARLFTLRNHSPISYLDAKEILRIEFHIKQMQVELAARAAQLNML